jgi:helicase
VKLIGTLIPHVIDLIGGRPLHIFGLGKPDITHWLFQLGVDSVDSSSFVRLAAEGRLWSEPKNQIQDPSPMDRLHIALCNLAEATGKTLPLSTNRLIFSTHALYRQAKP